MNGIDLLLAEHAKVRTQFAAFGAEPSGAVVGIIFDLLAAHDDAEQSALYPMVEALLDADAAWQARDEHARVKQLIDQARQQEGAALLATVQMLEAAVMAHVEREERDLFPRLVDAAGPDDLAQLGARLLQTEQRVG